MRLDYADNITASNSAWAGERNGIGQAERSVTGGLRYPVELIEGVVLPDGQRVTVRPVLPQDGPVTKAFFRNLSVRSRHNQFMRAFKDLPEALLTQFTHVDYHDHLALIAEVFIDEQEIGVGEARYVMTADGKSAEFAVSIADGWQGRGLGTLLLCRLIKAAAKAGVETIIAETLATNTAMLHLARKGGFAYEIDSEIAGLIHLSLNIADGDALSRCSRTLRPER